MIAQELELNTLLRNTKTNFTDTLEFWLELAELNLSLYSAQDKYELVTAQLWLNELVLA